MDHNKTNMPVPSADGLGSTIKKHEPLQPAASPAPTEAQATPEVSQAPVNSFQAAAFSTDAETPSKDPINQVPSIESSPKTTSFPAMSYGETVNDEPPRRGLFKKPSRAYLAEYAVLLIITYTLIWISVSMFGGIIDYIAGQKPSPIFGGGWAYTSSIASLSSIAVLLPMFVLLTRRTKTSEEEASSLKNLGWRKGFLSFFLILIMLGAIGFSIAFVYEVFSKIASSGLSAGEQPELWKTLFKHGFGAVFFGVTAWLYSKDYRTQVSDVIRKSERLHRYILAILVVIIALLFAFIPLKQQRNMFVDQIIVTDLRALKSAITSYETKERSLPNSINDLDDLSEELEARVDKFGYEYSKGNGTYELCAEFRTSTKDQGGSGNALEGLLTGSSFNSFSETEDPSVHDKGRDCFTYEARYPSSTSNLRFNSNQNSFDSYNYDYTQ